VGADSSCVEPRKESRQARIEILGLMRDCQNSSVSCGGADVFTLEVRTRTSGTTANCGRATGTVMKCNKLGSECQNVDC
jgi:hypothetical protein